MCASVHSMSHHQPPTTLHPCPLFPCVCCHAALSAFPLNEAGRVAASAPAVGGHGVNPARLPFPTLPFPSPSPSLPLPLPFPSPSPRSVSPSHSASGLLTAARGAGRERERESGDRVGRGRRGGGDRRRRHPGVPTPPTAPSGTAE